MLGIVALHLCLRKLRWCSQIIKSRKFNWFFVFFGSAVVRGTWIVVAAARGVT